MISVMVGPFGAGHAPTKAFGGAKTDGPAHAALESAKIGNPGAASPSAARALKRVNVG